MKLIFMHGSGGSKEAWHYQTKHFPDAEAIDLPGHPDGEPQTSVEGYVDWLRDYVHEKGYRDVVLAGHSLGSAIAQLYALKYPDDLKGLILIGAGARLKVHPMYLEMLEKAKSDPSMLEEFLETGWELIDPELKEVLWRRSLENGPAVFLNDMLCCDRFDIMERVGEIKLPTLVLCGSEDIMTPPKYTRYLTDKIEGAREVIIEGGTHMVFAEKPREVNQAIEDFLSNF
ncbi:MAG: alpha/beta hydrolase [Dehalococcoidia bacterium]|nr:alpha/beta hydrolase [Dehalococcoidia bacterium]